MNSETPLIIAGMHRSGTSLLARFVHRSGIDLGDALIGSRDSNPYGHFEDVGFVRFHERVLVRESDHPMWAPETPEPNAADRLHAERLIAERKGKHHWGWKDPRTCLFLNFWHTLLPRARYLFVARHPLMVLDSLSRRTNSRVYHLQKHNTFVRAWLLHNRECLRFHQQHKENSLLVTLEQILEHQAAFVTMLSDHLKFELSTDVFHASHEPEALRRARSRRLWVSPWLRMEALSLHDELEGTSCLRQAVEASTSGPVPHSASC
jgi:hypothetical protein